MAQPSASSDDDGNPQHDPRFAQILTLVRATVFLICVALGTMVVLVLLTGSESAIYPLTVIITAFVGLVKALGNHSRGR